MRHSYYFCKDATLLLPASWLTEEFHMRNVVKIDNYRKRCKIVGYIDIIIFLWTLFVSVFWYMHSCRNQEQHHEQHNTTTDSEGKTHKTGLSPCHDARNISGLDWSQNTTKFGVGVFLQLTVAHQETVSGRELETLVGSDIALTVIQLLAALLVTVSFTTDTIQPAKSAGKYEAEVAAIYIICNLPICIGYAVWRALEGAWIGLGFGVVLRAVLITVMIEFFIRHQRKPGHSGGGARTTQTKRKRKKGLFCGIAPTTCGSDVVDNETRF